MSKKIIAPIAAVVLLALAGAAQAATKTASFTVSATVAKNCIISATDMDFGTFDLDDVSNRTTTSNILVRCTNGTNYEVRLSPGGSGDFANRRLASGGNSLVYNLYTGSGATDPVWGDGTNSTGVVNDSGTGMGIAQQDTLVVHGRIPAAGNETALPGTYTDSITATIEY